MDSSCNICPVMKNYVVKTRKNQVLAYVRNTPKIRREIREWNRANQQSNIRLRPRGRGPVCIRSTSWTGTYDTTLDQAPILAVYWMEPRKSAGRTIWNVAPTSVAGMPLFLRMACL